MSLSAIREVIARKEREMLRLLAELVRIESPSDDREAVNRAVQWVEAVASRSGAKTKHHGGRKFGDLLELRWGAAVRTRGEKPVMLLGHLDTVWPIGTLKRMPFKMKNGRAFGPGVFDMKAGVVMALTAMETLTVAGALGAPVIMLLNSDEEVGSGQSRIVTEKLALGSREVFVLEPAQGDSGAYKTARKGVGQFRLDVNGVASHSGVDFAAGASAVLELAHQIEVVSAMTDPEKGTTVNAGVIGGGTRSNVVPGHAWAEVDLRVATKRDAVLMERRLRALKPADRRCSVTITGGLNRPPMERTKATVGLFRQAEALARELGFALEESATGGGSDGNFTSALGVPTLDGMGAVGNGAHAEDESICIDALVPRTALLAAMIAKTIGRGAS